MYVPYTFTEEAERLVNESLVQVSLDRSHGSEDAAYDLCATHDATVYAGARDTLMVRTGVCVAIPEGCAGLVLPRSGLANIQGLIIPNSPGLIDPGYRGEILVGFRLPMTFTTMQKYQLHRGTDKYEIRAGDRIAQLLFVGPKALRPMYMNPRSFDVNYCNTERGEGGFGSTGR